MKWSGTAVKVANLMQSDVKAVTVDDRIVDVLITLADAHIHGLPVLEKRGGRLLGVLSASDLLSALGECGNADDRERLLHDTTAAELMTRRPATIAPESDAKEAAEQMLYLDVHRLFVVAEGELVGVISQSDIVRAVGGAKI